MKNWMPLLAVGALAGPALAGPIAYINEFHYDNTGTDEGEFIEVVLDPSLDPADFDIYLYNGADGQVYSDTGTPGQDIFNLGTDFLSHGVLGDGFSYYTLSLPSNGLQNGAPDGIALAAGGLLVEFLSYEGVFTGVGLVADGVMSMDVGVFQSSSTPIGSSLQRIEFGSTWVATDGSNTFGAINVPGPAALSLLAMGGLVARRRRR